MTEKSERHPFTGQPIGPPVDATPARLPEPVVLEGRYGRVERLRTDHAASLWNAVKGHDPIWTYLSAYGPFANFAAFAEWLAGRVALDDPYSYAIIDSSGQAVGIATLMEIRPAMRVIEVGHIVYSPALAAHAARHRGAIPARALRVRDARLPALRMEMQRAQCAVATRRAALRLCL